MYCDETVRRMVDELAMQNEIWREHEELWGEEGADLDDYTFDFDDEDVPERNDRRSSVAYLQTDR